MNKKGVSFLSAMFLTHVISSGFFILFIPSKIEAKAETVLNSLKPAYIRQYSAPPQPRYSMGYVNSDYQLMPKYPIFLKPASAPDDNIFRIQASDAIDGVKYSQPDIAYSLLSFNSGVKVPSSSLSKHKFLKSSAQDSSIGNIQEDTFSDIHAMDKNLLKSMRDMRYLNSAVDGVTTSSFVDKEPNHRLENRHLDVLDKDRRIGDLNMQTENNFTDASDNLVSVSSDAVISYEVPATEFNNNNADNSSVKQSTDLVSDVPSHNYSDSNSFPELPVSEIELSGYTSENPIHSSTVVYMDYTNQTNLTDTSLSTSMFPSIKSDENITNLRPSADSEKKLSSGTVAGIVIAVLVSVTLLSSAVIYLLYRKFNGKCTSVVESKFNTDNCGYLDDSLRSSIYLNNHIELPKESSEEMTSLDNDSFLNSLETMTIQNYWADNSKNTKV